MKGPHFKSARTGPGSKDDWRTPPEMIPALQGLFGRFEVDAAASPGRSVFGVGWRYGLDGRWYGDSRMNSLDALDPYPWAELPTFLNPPYSLLRKFMERVVQAVTVDGVPSVVTLTAARTDTKAWQLFMEHATEVILVQGRVRFWAPDGSGPLLSKGKPVGAPFPSAVALWTPRPGGPRFYSMTRDELGG